MAKSVEAEHRMVPIVKQRIEATRSCRRPNTCDIDAMTGWNMADVRR